MSSNAIANQATNKFEEILGFFKGNGASITENVDTSKKKTKLSDEAKAALIERIQENLSGIDVSQDIKSKDNDNGLLSSKVVTLEDTSSDKLKQMNAVFSDVLKLIQDSDGKIDKTFLSQKSEENPELRAKVIELATVVSMTKNEGSSPEASTVKSLSEAVVGKTNPKLLIDSKAGLTQDETNAIKMMLFSDKDSTAFAGALTLLQSVQNYKEVAPDTLTEKEVDGVKTLKAKAGSFYKKIERALGNNESANFVKQVLKNTIDTALHGRLNDEQQAVLRDDPSLKAVYERVHTDLVNTVDDSMRKDLVKPLKEEIENTFKNNTKITQYFGDISEDKVKGFLRKLGEGVLKMIRPAGKGFADNAFGTGSFHETNQKIMNLSKDANSALIALNRLESSVGTVQQRLEDGGAARLDVPLSVIAKSGAKGEEVTDKLIPAAVLQKMESATSFMKFRDAQVNLFTGLKNEMAEGGPDKNSNVSALVKKITDELTNNTHLKFEVTDSSKNHINGELNNLGENQSKEFDNLIITKTMTEGMANFNVKIKGDEAKSFTLNQENTKNLLALESSLKDKLTEEGASSAQDFLEKVKNLYNAKHGTNINFEGSPEERGENFKKVGAFLMENPSAAIEAMGGSTVSVFFGLDKSTVAEDKKTLATLAELVPDIKSDVSQIKSDLDILSQQIARQVKDQSAKFAHVALTSGAALKEGLLSADGETFQVTNSLKQNLFATAVNEVRSSALEKFLTMERMSAEQEADFNKVGKSIKENALFKALINTQHQENNSPKDSASQLKTALESLKDNADTNVKNFAKEFLANSENKELFKIEDNTIEDKAKYKALLSNLALDIVYTKEDGTSGKATANKIGETLKAFLDENNVKSNTADSSSDEVRSLRADVANTKNVLAASPDKKEMLALKSVVDGRIKDFSSLNTAPSDIKEKILDAMVTGLMTMAKNSAVKLEPLAEMIKAAEAPSESNEAAFFNKLKTHLVAA